MSWRWNLLLLNQAVQDYELAEQREELEELKREFEESIDEIANLRQDLEGAIDERQGLNRSTFPTLGSVDKEILLDLISLDPSISDDAFLLEAATFVGDMASDEYTDHEIAWRNHISSLANQYLGDADKFLVQWTVNGEAVVSLRDH
jgi:hypothetical protein